MATKETNAATYYANVFKSWPKAVGSKPDAALLDTVHKLGARPGKQALALALMLRPEGVSGGQIVQACGAPQLNKMRDTCSKGLAKRVAAPATPEGHTVYKIELTGKGTKKVEAAVVKADAEPAKGKGKPKGAKKAKVETPANTVSEPIPGIAAEIQEQPQA